jgi:hypothetical protein
MKWLARQALRPLCQYHFRGRRQAGHSSIRRGGHARRIGETTYPSRRDRIGHGLELFCLHFGRVLGRSMAELVFEFHLAPYRGCRRGAKRRRQVAKWGQLAVRVHRCSSCRPDHGTRRGLPGRALFSMVRGIRSEPEFWGLAINAAQDLKDITEGGLTINLVKHILPDQRSSDSQQGNYPSQILMILSRPNPHPQPRCVDATGSCLNRAKTAGC